MLYNAIILLKCILYCTNVIILLHTLSITTEYWWCFNILVTDECASNPCLYGAECRDLDDGYTCDCLPELTGANCETRLPVCDSEPCVGSGVCRDDYTANDIICICGQGYETGHLITFKYIPCSVISSIEKPVYMHYTTLYHSIPLYTTLYYSILLYTTLYYSILLYTTLYYSILLCTTLYHSNKICWIECSRLQRLNTAWLTPLSKVESLSSANVYCGLPIRWWLLSTDHNISFVCRLTLRNRISHPTSNRLNWRASLLLQEDSADMVTGTRRYHLVTIESRAAIMLSWGNIVLVSFLNIPSAPFVFSFMDVSVHWPYHVNKTCPPPFSLSLFLAYAWYNRSFYTLIAPVDCD